MSLLTLSSLQRSDPVLFWLVVILIVAAIIWFIRRF